MAKNFLAFDLGAESGRAMRASLHGGVLTLAEVCRFPNGPVRDNGSLRWDIYRLWHEMQDGARQVQRHAAREHRGGRVGVRLRAAAARTAVLVEPPFTYRDARTDGVMEQVFAKVSRDRIYATTGIQFLWFNTLYQLYAACRNTPEAIAAAHRFATIPDVLNLWLSGTLKAEYTNATTTQCVDAVKRTWARELLEELGHSHAAAARDRRAGYRARDRCAGRPTGRWQARRSSTPACHDTGSAFAAVPAGDDTAFLSSGTWSLLGTELSAPIITPRAMELDFTNEGGVCGTTRLLKNIGGLWLLQSCRRSWAASGRDYDYDELVAAAGSERPFQVLLDPDSPGFRNPDDMVIAIDGFCRQTGQPSLVGPPSYSRAIMESLAFKYRAVLESLEELTGRRFDEIRVVGGGARNRLLNQFTADATGRTVIAGPVEATALGNVAMQMLATGAVTSLAEARAIIDRSFPVERFEPAETDRWEPHYQRFRDYHGVHLCLTSSVSRQSSCRTCGTTRRRPAVAARTTALSIEPARRRPAHHQLRRRQHQLEVRSAGSADRRADARAGGEGQWRRPAVDHGVRLRDSLHGQARGADSPLPRRGARRRDGGVLSAGRLRRESRRGVDRYAAARVSALRPRRSPASRLGDRARGQRQRQGEAGGVQPAVTAARSCGCPGSDRASSWR